MSGITFDSGALMALSRNSARMLAVWRHAVVLRTMITVPTVVVAEWHREPSKRNARILATCTVEPLTQQLAELAGEALAQVRGATTIDAIVMASAAQRGDVVYTSDVDDLQRLQAYFQAVERIFHV